MDEQMTRPSLLVRVRDLQDSQAWDQFIEVYSPFVYQFMRRQGLQDADAADLTQEVMRTVIRSIKSFEHGGRHGSFRKWLIMVARSRLCDFAAKHKKQVAGSGNTDAWKLLEEQPSQDAEDELEQEYQKCVFQWAAGTVRCQFQDLTWQAFWQTYVEGKENKEVAERLGMSLDAVYQARSRVLVRLKKQIQQVEG